MWDLTKNSIIAFFTGKLWQHPVQAYGMLVAGMVFSATLFVVLGRVFGLHPYLAAGLAGFIGGVAQPRLFKNLKYR